MNAAKTGYVAEFQTGYLQREIRKEVFVSGGTDAGLRDGALGIAPGRMVTLSNDTITPVVGNTVTAGNYIVAQSDDTIRDFVGDYNYVERYNQMPNLVVKNDSAEKKTVALYKIVNVDDVKVTKLGEPVTIYTGTVDNSNDFTAAATTYQLRKVGATRYKVMGEIPFFATGHAGNGSNVNEFAIAFVDSDITAATGLPTGNIVKITTAIRTSTYTKDAFDNDLSIAGSTKFGLIYCGKITSDVKEVVIEITWTSGETTTYAFDLSEATLEASA